MAFKDWWNKTKENIASTFDGNTNTQPTGAVGKLFATAYDGITSIGNNIENKKQEVIHDIATSDFGNKVADTVQKGTESEIVQGIGNAVIGGNPVNKAVDTISNGEYTKAIEQAFDTATQGAGTPNGTGATGNTGTGTSNEQEIKETAEENRQQALNDQKNLWEREDAIRKEIQAREDSAYQRAVADMRKAGINAELVGINPANSGGGIINASAVQNTANSEINALTNLITNELTNEIKVDENQKDRINQILSSVLMAYFFKKI